MTNLKEIRGRINSVTSIIKITGAMKMVSAAKLKKAKEALLKIQPYTKKIEDLINIISFKRDLDKISFFFKKNQGKPKLIIAVSSNRGLCGGFNASVTRMIISQMNAFLPTPYLLTIGKKAKEILDTRFSIYQDCSTLLDPISYSQVSLLCDTLINSFIQGSFHSIQVVYHKFKTATLQQLITEQILPITISSNTLGKSQTNYLIEPSKIFLFKNLLSKKVKIHFFNILFESYIAEHSSRMNAMHKATDNASSLKNELFIAYNKARQAAITREILEIIGGSEESLI